MSEPKPRILIVEDDADARSILATAFSHWGYPLLVATDGDEALRLATDCLIDVALLDVVMPGLSGLELAECLRKIDPDILIMVMTAYSTAEDAVKAQECGVMRYLPKPCTPGLVRGVVDSAWSTYLIDCQEWLGDVCVDWRQQCVIVDGRPHLLRTLARRERDVLAELSAGKSDQAIADALELGVASVRTYMRGIMHKLGLKNRAQAALLGQACRRRKGNRQ